MEPRISLVTLGVDDVERAVEFYRDGLGLPVYDRTDEVAFFDLDGAWLSVFSRTSLAADAGVSAESGGFAGVTLAHNVSTREEVDDVLRTAVDAGAELVKAAEDTNWGGYSGYFADPDGHLWEVAWNPHFDLT